MAVISVSYCWLGTPSRYGLELGEGSFDHPPTGSRELTGLIPYITPHLPDIGKVCRHRSQHPSRSATLTGWTTARSTNARIDQPMARAAT